MWPPLKRFYCCRGLSYIYIYVCVRQVLHPRGKEINASTSSVFIYRCPQRRGSGWFRTAMPEPVTCMSPQSKGRPLLMRSVSGTSGSAMICIFFFTTHQSKNKRKQHTAGKSTFSQLGGGGRRLFFRVHECSLTIRPNSMFVCIER